MTRTPLKFALLLSSLALSTSLTACTHFGTNVAGSFACREATGDCQPISVIDAAATREAAKTASEPDALPAQRKVLGSSNPARTGERTLRVVIPAHVDERGTLHEEAAVWTVVETPRWTGEPEPGRTAKPANPFDSLRQALKDVARRAAEAQLRAQQEPEASSGDAVSAENTPEPAPALPLALPSRAVEVGTGAEGSVMSPSPHDRTPRHLPKPLTWPSPAEIEAAKAGATSPRSAGGQVKRSKSGSPALPAAAAIPDAAN